MAMIGREHKLWEQSVSEQPPETIVVQLSINSKVEGEVEELGADTLRRYKDHTRLSPLSFVILGGRPAGSACSKIAVSPFRAASYMRLANATISGESAVG